MPGKPLPRTPYLNDNFRIAIKQFGLDLIKTAKINNPGDKGSAREDALRKFFQERLPKKFSVTKGEIVDLLGSTSTALDLIFYDSNINFPLISTLTEILPAEASIVSIEVKTKITAQEIKSIVGAAEKLRALRPFDRKLGGADVGNKTEGTKKLCRYYHCVFAYDTDLQEKNWAENESKRFEAAIQGRHLVDSVYVLNKGLFHPQKTNKMLPENEQGGAISNFYFGILNFLQRESARRWPAPYEKYVTHAPRAWKNVE